MEGRTTAAAVAIDSTQYDRIGALLDEIADTRTRLDEVVLTAKAQLERMKSSFKQLKATCEKKENFFDLLPPLRGSARRVPPRNLTAREIEVLRLIAQGLSTKQIADRLQIRFKTAVNHRTNVLQKMDCHESASLVRLAIRAGLVA